MEKKKIKVCHIITKLELGGAQKNTLYTVSHLNKDKFETVLITGSGGILEGEAKRITGTKVCFVGSLVRSIRPCKDFFALLQLWFILLKERPDIVHTHSSKAGIIGRWAAWLARVPVIMHTFHGYGFNDFQKPIMKRMLISIERIAAKITDKLIVVTTEDQTRGIISGIGMTDQYILIRSGIETKKLKNLAIDRVQKRKSMNIVPDVSIITTVGPFKPQKNLSDFISMAGIVSKEYPKSVFLVIGDGEQRAKLDLEIFAKKLNDNVRLLGWREDVEEILSISDVFVLTSLWEGLPRSMVEAMVLKVPVVANAVCGVKEIIKHEKNGFLSEPLHPEQTASYVLKCLNDPNYAKNVAEAGANSIGNEFDIDVMVNSQENLYELLLKNTENT